MMLTMKKYGWSLVFIYLTVWSFSATAAPEKNPLESTVPPEPYHVIRKPDWVNITQLILTNKPSRWRVSLPSKTLT